MLNFFWLLFLSLFNSLLYAGGNSTITGARSLGIANTSVTLYDPFAFYNNIAGINKYRRAAAFLSCEIPFGIVSLKKVSAAAIYPVKDLTAGIGLSSFGNEDYHEFKAGLGIAHSIQNVSLGIKVNYNELAISEVTVRRNIVLEFGGITELTKRLHVGAFISHFNKVFETRANTALPIIMKAGIAYLASKELVVAIETEKTSYAKNIIKAGIEYTIAEKLSLRTGINTDIFTPFFGLGIKNKQLQLDYALKSHPYLGLSHSMNFIFFIPVRK